MRLLSLLILLFTASLALPAHAAPPAPSHAPAGWSAKMQVTPIGSHLYGNPNARLKFVEYISYTCPHCAHFEAQSTAPLWQHYMQTGNVSVEIRHLVRDPVDMAAAALANCGPPDKFLANHAMFLGQQTRWIAPIGKASAAQRKRWESGAPPVRMKAIATDFGFYAMMQGRGYTRPQVDACLTDGAMLKRLAAQTEGADQLGIDATPGLVLNGAPLAGTYDWDTLKAQLDARL